MIKKPSHACFQLSLPFFNSRYYLLPVSIFKWAHSFVWYDATDEGSCIAAETFGFLNHSWLVNFVHIISQIVTVLHWKGTAIKLLVLMVFLVYFFNGVLQQHITNTAIVQQVMPFVTKCFITMQRLHWLWSELPRQHDGRMSVPVPIAVPCSSSGRTHVRMWDMVK